MSSPTDRVYTATHEWHKLDGDTVTLGLTRYAVDQLTDITFIDLRPVGTAIEAGGVVGEVESVKATSDVYCAVAGRIVEVNPALADDPGLVNRDPYDAGWLVRLQVTDRSGLDACMDAATYDAQHPA